MLEQQDENKARESLCSVLHNQRFPFNVKSLCGGEGARNGSSGLLNIYCSFITVFLIQHSLHFPNNNLVSEASGAPASRWYSGRTVTAGEGTTREAIHGGQTVNHCYELRLAARAALRDVLTLFPADSNCTLSLSTGLSESFLYPHGCGFSSILFCNCGYFPITYICESLFPHSRKKSDATHQKFHVGLKPSFCAS